MVGLPAEQPLGAEPSLVHPVRGPSPHPDHAAVLERRYVSRLQWLPAVHETGRPRVGAQEHRRISMGDEERLERGFVSGAKQPDLGHGSARRGALQLEDLERQATRQDPYPTRVALATRHGPIDQDDQQPGEPA